MSRRAKYIWLGVLMVALVVMVLAITGVFGEPGDAGGGTAVTTEAPAATVTTATSAPTPPQSTEPTVPPTTQGGVTSTSAPTATTVPTTAPPEVTTTLPPAEDDDAGEEITAPVPLGEAIVLGQWRIGVSNVELDATETVLGYVDFNEEPAPGHQFLIVELSGVYTGNSFVQPVFDWALVKPDFTHVPDGLECGVIPASIYDVDQVAPGEQFTANVCFEIETAQVTDDLVFTLGLLDATGRERFFSLR